MDETREGVVDFFFSPPPSYSLGFHQYDPYRFSPQRDEGKGLEFFLGFGRGRHQCAGESIAYLQEKILFSTLFRFYDLQLVAAVPPPNPNQPLAVLRPMQPILVKYKRLATPRY